jgi:putative membrane protein
MPKQPNTSMTEPDASWKALPVAAVVALYITGIQRFVRENLFVFFGAGTGIAISDALGWREFGLGALLVLLVGLLIALVYHRRFRYRFDDDAVRVRKGLMQQQELKVRLERIQNVGFSQPLYLKPLRLVRVTLETPGAAQTEVNLPGIALDEAAALRDRVSGDLESGQEHEQSDSEDPVGSSAPDSGTRFEATAADLFRYGMTSNQIWILLALVGAPVSNWIESRMTQWVEQLQASGALDPEAFQSAPFLLALLVGFVIIAAALLVMTVSGLLAIVRFSGFRLLQEGNRFKSRFGLLDARENTLRADKLHSIESVQTAVGRLLNQWHVIGHQTGGAQPGQEYREDRRFLVPGIASRRLEGVMETLRRTRWTMPEWQPIHRRFRSMLWRRLAATGVLAAFAVWWLLPGTAMWPLYLFAGLIIFMLAAVHLVWRRWGYAMDDRRIRIRHGMIGQKIVEFDTARCQQVGVTTSPYQRRHGLASLTIRLPHGEQRIPYLDDSIANRIANLVLYRVETARSHGL